MERFPAHEFQKATIHWVKKQLLEENDRKVKRFLVADEVGLGKTIIAKHVVDEIRKRNKNKNPSRIIYITSNLDIAQQNCHKLANKEEIIQADRISLAFRESILGKYENNKAAVRKKNQPKIYLYSFTPATSIFIKKSTGTLKERRFLALLCMKYFNLPLSRAVNIFCQVVDVADFKKLLKAESKIKFSLPSEIHTPLLPILKSIQVGENQIPFIEALTKPPVNVSDSRDIIKKFRYALSEVLLGHLNPDLIILDEFQKFGKIVEWPSTDKLVKRFLKPEIPTLLLSATPYCLYSAGSTKLSSLTGGEHYKDLKNRIQFLFNEKDKSVDLISKIGGYGKKLVNITRGDVKNLIVEKQKIEDEMKTVMSRTERMMFERLDFKLFKVNFLSDRFLENETDELEISRDAILEYLLLRNNVNSRLGLFTYWKSASHPYSYMEGYKLIENAKKRGCIYRPSKLYTQRNKKRPQHIKLDYMYKDIFKNGENFSYLWLPPSRPYYDGAGIFSQDAMLKASPKKGLCFSVWKFVPRYIATELALLKKNHFKNIQKKSSSSFIRATTTNWGKFYFPSPFLANIICHVDFVNSKNQRDLKKLTKKKIENALKKEFGLTIQKRRGVGSKAWEILRFVDFYDNDRWQKIKRLYTRRSKYSKKQKEINASPFTKKDFKGLKDGVDDVTLSTEAINELTTIAIASPAVCFYRALENALGRKLSNVEWEELIGFCIHVIRSFINRQGTFEAVSHAYSRSGNIATKMQRYFLDGNIQAVLDEYMFLLNFGKDPQGFSRYMHTFSVIWGQMKSRMQLPQPKNKNKTFIQTDSAIAFGDGKFESDTRENVRSSFNSPFQPMVLATTSIGQEGLDFHLYCKDIYHWDLPSNPVAFEQREGRINRYNNLMVRHNLVNCIDDIKLNPGENLWCKYFDLAKNYCHMLDRYSFGLSPNWMFTPHKDKKVAQINRHVLDIPFSRDRFRYEKLMVDVVHYRLALGQPNQAKFLEDLRNTLSISNEDVKGLIINLFPRMMLDRKEKVKAIVDMPEQVGQLAQDVFAYLEQNRNNLRYDEFENEIKRLTKILSDLKLSYSLVDSTVPSYADGNRNYAVDIKKLGEDDKLRLKNIVFALHYFVDPHDYFTDFTPECGFDDDIEILKNAPNDLTLSW